MVGEKKQMTVKAFLSLVCEGAVFAAFLASLFVVLVIVDALISG